MKQSDTQTPRCYDYEAHLTREIESARRNIRATLARMEMEFHRRKGTGKFITSSQPKEAQ